MHNLAWRFRLAGLADARQAGLAEDSQQAPPRCDSGGPTPSKRVSSWDDAVLDPTDLVRDVKDLADHYAGKRKLTYALIPS